jgi:fucose 4-O-acetylase-like acetyltransferase
MKIERFTAIDKATGIAISLVIYGHMSFLETQSLPWYAVSRDFIYKFHMPLFLCLSGFVVFLSTSKRNIKSQSDYLNFQKKKITKFLYPYIVFSIIAILVDIFYYHATVSEINNAIFSFFFSPNDGILKFVWYLYVLTGLYLIAPFLIKLESYHQYLLLALGFLLTNLSPSHLFSSDLFCKFFFFFLSGGLIYKNADKFFLFLKKNGLWILIMTLLLISIDFSFNLIIPFQFLSIAVILSVLYISTLRWPGIIEVIFKTMGVNSFAIYLLNVFIINVYFIFFKSYLQLEIGAFFVFSCLILTVLISILMRSILNKIIPAKIYTL